LALLIAITIPQATSAAWWNPFSWKIFSRIFTPKTEVVYVAPSTDNIASTTNEISVVEKLRAEIEELKKNQTTQIPTSQTINVQTKTENVSTPKPTTSPIPVPQTTETLTRDELFDDLMKKYTSFRSVITNEISRLKKNSSFYTERHYFQFIDNLLVATNGDLGYLTSIKNWATRPSGIEEIYLAKFNKLNNDYNVEFERFKNEYRKESDSKTRQDTVEYIKQYKYQLYEAGIHIEAAGLLYKFDKIFGTNYAQDFESKKTQVETVEFANRFLIDQE